MIVLDTNVITTYLEMFENPLLPAAKEPGDNLIMRASHPTVPFYRFLYNTVGGNWQWIDRKKLSDDELKMIIQNETVEVNVLYIKGVPAGYVELDFRQEKDVEVSYFGLMPEFIGHGLGKYLLSWAVKSVWAREPNRLWVHTCSLDHPGALKLYQKCGFKIYKTEEHKITQENQ